MAKALTEDDLAVRSILYDMHVLDCAIRLLKASELGRTGADKDNAQVALAAVMVKARSLIDFLEYPVKKKKFEKHDIKASVLLNGYRASRSSAKGETTLLEAVQALRDSTNKWGAHLTLQRVRHEGGKGRRPKRRSARTTAAEILHDAKRFVREYARLNGELFLSDANAKTYWKRLTTPLPKS